MGETPVFTDRIKDGNKRGAWGWSIFQTTEGHCSYCGEPLIFDGLWHLDHKMPRSRGGKWKGNLIPACPRCNLQKSSYTPTEFKNWIKHKLRVIFSRAFEDANDLRPFLPPGDQVRVWADLFDIMECVDQTQIVFYSDKIQGGD